MEPEKTVRVDLTTIEVRALLLSHLNQSNIRSAESVANIIIGHLALTEKGLGQLFKGLIGIFPTLMYTPGDFIWVNLAALPGWRINKDKTAVLPTVKDGFILAEIMDCNVYKSSPYNIKYTAMRDSVPEPVEELTEINESNIRDRAEDFVDILDLLENFKNNNTE